MKIDILDDEEEEAGKRQEDKCAKDKSGNDSAVARDETGMTEYLLSGVLSFVRNIVRPIGNIRFYLWARQKEPIHMSFWVWEEVLESVTRTEMVNCFSLVCRALNTLCWTRLHGRKVVPHMVNNLWFDKAKRKKSRTKAILRIGSYWYRRPIIPIATDCPVPDYIQGFGMIKIAYLNSEVLKFVGNIAPRLVNIRLHLCLRRSKIKNLTCHKLQGLLNAIGGCSSISSLAISTSKFWRDVHAVLIDNIRESFQLATQPQSFMIEFLFCSEHRVPLDVFQLENERTGEVLNLERHPHYLRYKLYRCSRGEIQRWMEEASQAFEERTNIFCCY